MAKGWFFGGAVDDQSSQEHTGKYHHSSSIFPYTWEQVATAFWVRYPNPYSVHVLSEDVIDRQVTNDHRIITTRLLSKTNRLPKWGERFVRGAQNVLMVEESVVDLKNRTLTTYTRNIGYKKVMTVDERCTYKAAQDANSTELSRTAYIESSVYGFSKAIQAFGVERYKRNTTKTAGGYLYILEQLFAPPASPEKPHEPLSSRMAALTSKAESIRESAKRAKELAKEKTSELFHPNSKQHSSTQPSP